MVETGTAAHVVGYALDGAERFVTSFTATSTTTAPLVNLRSITADSSGNLYVNLSFRGLLRRDGDFVDNSGDACETLITSFDSSGALRFSRTHAWCNGADGGIELNAAETELHAVGNMETGATLLGRTFPSQITGLRAVFSASNGDILRVFANGDGAGQATVCPSEEEFDAVILAPNPAGGEPTLWVALYCDGDAEYGDGLVLGDSIIVGYDSSNDSHRFSFQVIEVGLGPDAIDFGGGLLATGGFARPPADFGLGTLGVNGDLDAFAAAYQADGTIEWGTVFGGDGNELTLDVAVGDDNSVFVVGDFNTTFTFGSETFTTTGNSTRGFALRVAN
jgi:hypothetical protein